MKDAYYFPHDANARNDEKIAYLVATYGLTAYGLFWCFIEVMHESIDGKLSVKLIDGLSHSFGVTEDFLLQFYNTAITVELFVTDGEKYWSERVLKNKGNFDEKRHKKSLAGKAGMQSRWGNDNSVITKHNKVKESKVKESKGNMYIRPTKEMINEYFIENSYPINEAQKFFDYYSANGWKVGKNPMRDFKAAIRNWISNSQNFKKNGLSTTNKNSAASGFLEKARTEFASAYGKTDS